MDLQQLERVEPPPPLPRSELHPPARTPKSLLRNYGPRGSHWDERPCAVSRNWLAPGQTGTNQGAQRPSAACLSTALARLFLASSNDISQVAGFMRTLNRHFCKRLAKRESNPCGRPSPIPSPPLGERVRVRRPPFFILHPPFSFQLAFASAVHPQHDRQHKSIVHGRCLSLSFLL
jgi:hypothetical protein